jgi:glycosyltransferase involved in cell wall biosynthesis
MTVGKMDSRKGKLLTSLIRHLESWKEEWYLYIVGEITSSLLLGKVDGNRVISVGHVPNVGDYLRECDVFVLASRMENLSVAVTEAMYVGKPVVCFDVGGMREIVSERTGFLIERFDVEKMAQAIIALLEDDDARKQKGLRAKEAVRDFDWDRSAEEYIEVFRSVLKNAGK